MENQQGINISTKIESIVLNNLKNASLTKEQKEQIDREKISFEFTVNIKTEESKKDIIIHNITRIFSDENKILYLGEIETTGVFKLNNFEEVKEANKGSIHINIIAAFVGALIATTRGILIAESKGKFLENVIIPIINPMTFFSQVVSASKEQIKG